MSKAGSEFSARLMRLRSRRCITQMQLSEMAGVPSAVISHYECGRREPGLKNLLRLCDALQCSPNDLVWDVEESAIRTQDWERLRSKLESAIAIMENAGGDDENSS